ncbi:RCC1 domain-containing protein [Cohnella abietis]|uniref:Uncharacterized protein n=1 Tax=Cohnella abietis TaxID=2507935 RepID=A0A3T1DBQ7_9BACL|nr:hypothetical protein [Cohnella abietis]BBI35540.1 hypothetical protein KCTCHS21_49390 [Cohnella abietis]
MKVLTARKMKTAGMLFLALTFLISTISAGGTVSAAEETKPLTYQQVLASQKKLSSMDKHYMAVKGNGSVSVWGARQKGEPTTPNSLKNIVGVASSRSKSFALRKDGSIAQWGTGKDLSPVTMGINPSTTKDAVAISSNRGTLLTVHRTGKVSFYHYIDDGGHVITNIPKNLSGVKDVSAGDSHALALKSNGAVVAWGKDYAGNTRVPSGLSNVVAIAAGTTVSSALRSDGTAVAWGMGLNTPSKQKIPYRDVVGIAAGFAEVFLLRSNGSLVVWQEGQAYTPTHLPKLAAIASSGEDELIGLTSDGRYMKWSQSFSHRALGGEALTSIASIAVPSYSSDYVAVRSDGTVFVKGDLGTAGLSDIPATTEGIASVSLSNHGLALTKAGNVLAWGNNSYGESTVPADLRDVVAVEAGYEYSLALKKDGSVIAWGTSRLGYTKVPSELKDVVAISAGDIALALKTDGSIVTWGGRSKPYSETLDFPKSIAITSRRGYQAALHEDGSISIWDRQNSTVTVHPKLKEGHSIVSLGGGNTEILWAVADDGTTLGFDYMTGKEVERIDGERGIVKVDTNLAVTKAGELIMLEPDKSNKSKFVFLP